jgi:hypothetical protein
MVTSALRGRVVASQGENYTEHCSHRRGRPQGERPRRRAGRHAGPDDACERVSTATGCVGGPSVGKRHEEARHPREQGEGGDPDAHDHEVSMPLRELPVSAARLQRVLIVVPFETHTTSRGGVTGEALRCCSRPYDGLRRFGDSSTGVLSVGGRAVLGLLVEPVL